MAAENMIIATSSLGGYSVHTQLSKLVFHEVLRRAKFRQFCQVKLKSGLHSGESTLVNKWSRITTAGGALTEGTDMTAHGFTQSQATVTVTELGNKVDLSSKLQDLSQHDVIQEIKKGLSDDAVETFDGRVEAAFNGVQIRYVATTTAGGAFTTNGTATATAAGNLNAYHVRRMVDYLRQNDVPPYTENGEYIGIFTNQALRGLMNDGSWENLMLYGDPARGFRGEAGKFENVRFIEQNLSMDGTIGASDVAGEGYIFGADFCSEALVHDTEIRVDPPLDGGRRLAIYWYALAGWGLIQNSYGVKFDSA